MSNKLDWISKHNIENNNEYGRYVFTGNYLAIQRPNHPKARSDGYVYIHHLQAEKKIGRSLKDGECVHHIDENKYNNSIENLMVFKTNSDHSAFHSGRDIYLDGDVWVAKPHENRICPVCGSFKDLKANVCYECYSNKKAANVPSKDKLLNLILNFNISYIGKLYGVDGNSVRKWCKKYNLPYSKIDIEILRNKNIRDVG